jgi:hypothetical protein
MNILRGDRSKPPWREHSDGRNPADSNLYLIIPPSIEKNNKEYCLDDLRNRDPGFLILHQAL